MRTDKQRAANLGAFAKPMRAALKSHKPIFWRKSAYGTANDAATNPTNQNKSVAPQATESQWGSAGSSISSLVLTGQNANKSLSEDEKQYHSKTPPTTWEETQLEETESTWDKEGDMDFRVSSSRRAGRGKRK